MIRKLIRLDAAEVVIGTILFLLALFCLFPLLHVLARSFSSEAAIVGGRIGLWPVDFNFAAYAAVFRDSGMMNSMFFSVYRTVLGTSINVVITALGAYPLAKKDLVGRKLIWLFILFTMFFSGGLIPLYLVIRSLKILDSVWALILPTTISTFNLLLMRTYFQGLPVSLTESARMDGCGELKILFRIIMPISTPILATLVLFYGMAHWNDFFQALIYMSSPERYPLQLMLQRMIAGTGMDMATGLPLEAMKSATVFFAIIPVLLIFPFLQKHFAKGAVLGAVKE